MERISLSAAARSVLQALGRTAALAGAKDKIRSTMSEQTRFFYHSTLPSYPLPVSSVLLSNKFDQPASHPDYQRGKMIGGKNEQNESEVTRLNFRYRITLRP